MSLFHISSPQGQRTHVNIPVHTKVFLDFDTTQAIFERVGNDLTISLQDGGFVVCDNFFALGKGEGLPDFLLLQGVTVSAMDFLQQQDIDITTDAGPEKSFFSSGLNDYDSTPGELLLGVAGLGELAAVGTAPLDRNTFTDVDKFRGVALNGQYKELNSMIIPPAARPEDSNGGRPADPQGPNGGGTEEIPTDPEVPGDGGAGENPVDPPQDPGKYQVRGVLGQLDDAPRSLLLPVYSDRVVAGKEVGEVTFGPAEGLPILSPELYSIVWDAVANHFVFTLTEAGRQALASLPEGTNQLIHYVQVSHGGGSYVMQVVVDRAGLFDEGAQNSADHAAGYLPDAQGTGLWASRYESTYHYNDSSSGAVPGLKITMGDADTYLRLTNLGGSGLVRDSVVTLGDGDNKIEVTGSQRGIYYSRLESGNGDDSITIQAKGGHAVSVATIDMGGGDNTLLLSGTGTGILQSTVTASHGNNFIAVKDVRQGMFMGNVTTGSGNDTVVVSLARSQEIALWESHLDLGDGDNEIYITNNSVGLFNGSKITTGNGNDKIVIESIDTTTWNHKAGSGIQDSKIDAGHGNNTISVTGGVWGLNYGHIVTGDGDDHISIKAVDDVVSNVVAMNGKSSLDVGNGNNFVEIAGQMGIAYGGLLIAGSGDDTILIESTRGNPASSYWADAVYGAHIDAGDGNNQITTVGHVSSDSSITTGSGNDIIKINGRFEGAMYTDHQVSFTDNHVSAWSNAKASGEDFVSVKGSMSGTIMTGGGDDTIVLGGGIAAGGQLDGGSGLDHLLLEGSIAYNVDSAQVRGIEYIDMRNATSGDTLILHFTDLLDGNLEADFTWDSETHKALFVKSDGNDKVILQGGASMDVGSYTSADGVHYQVYEWTGHNVHGEPEILYILHSGAGILG